MRLIRFLIFCACTSLATLALGVSGDLDATFGSGGIVTTAVGTGDDRAYSVAVQADGKIVVAGSSLVVRTPPSSNGTAFALTRYNADGTLDGGFGSGGKVITEMTVSAEARCMAIQSDGKIVVGGYSPHGYGYAFTVVRYHANGSLDTGFGTAGKVVTKFMAHTDDYGGSLVLQSDGKIIVAGSSRDDVFNYSHIVMVRYHADGSPDLDFGSGSRVTTEMENESEDLGSVVTVQADDKILVAGRSLNDTCLMRYHRDGSLDTGFGSSGSVSTNFFFGGDQATSVVVQGDGKILITGHPYISSVGLARLNSDGSLDSTFGNGGRASTTYNVSTIVRSMALQKDGRILLAGENAGEFSLLRFTAAGILDAKFGVEGFGTTGRISTSVGNGSNSGRSVALQSDGKIVVAGYAQIGGNNDFALMRHQNALAPSAVTLPATGVTGSAVMLHATVNANEDAAGGSTQVVFEVSSDGVNYASVAATPGAVTGSSDTPVTATLNGLIPGANYRVRVKGTSSAGVTRGADLTFMAATPSDDATLASLTLSNGTLNPTFASGQLDYTVTVPAVVSSLRLTPALAHAGATVKVNGHAVASGSASGVILLAMGSNVITLGVKAQDAETAQTYTVTVMRESPSVGILDPTFGSHGKVTTPVGNYGDSGRSVVVQRDGKIVVAGFAYKLGGNPPDVTLVRYLANGSLDTGFGDSGKVIAAVGSGSAFEGDVLALQSDDKILVAGHTLEGAVADFALARYNSNGALDSSFGSGGKVTTSINGNAGDARSVAVQSDGKIVIAGFSYNGVNWDISLVRYETNGALDTTFGSGGIVTFDGGGNEYNSSVTLQGDGKILVSHFTSTYRFNAGGSLDTGFGNDGRITHPFRQGQNVYPITKPLMLQSDGKIVVVGSVWNGTNDDIVVLRYQKDGTPDSSFGIGGKVTGEWGPTDDTARSAVQQSDGKILVAGISHNGTSSDFLLVRYLSDGSLDTTFGLGGRMVTPIGTGNDEAYCLALQKNGKIVVAGSSHVGGVYDFALARFTNDMPLAPEIDITVDGDGAVGEGGVLPFGDVGLGGQGSRVLLIANDGGADLTGLSATLDGPHAGMFRFVPPPGAVVPGSSAGLILEYVPTVRGEHLAILHVTSNDDDESPYDITLTGRGITAVSVLPKTLPATGISFAGATLKGSIDDMGDGAALSFDYGLTAALGASVDAVQDGSAVDGRIPVRGVLTGLQPHAKYFYRLRTLGVLGAATGATLTFTTQNRAPVAVEDELAVLPGAVVVLDVLGNDTDPDGDALSLVSNAGVLAVDGRVVRVGNQLVFTAASGFDGASFTYVMKEGFGGTATGTVVLTVGTSEIDPLTKDIASAGGVYDVGVEASGAWSVNEAVAWISAVQVGGDTARITVLPHAGTAERKATIKIANIAHEITQAGVLTPALTMPENIPGGVISGDYVLAIPTTNGPVTYTLTNLPPGLTMNQATGVIGGRPTKAGAYPVTVKARNAAGSAPVPLSFTITVTALPEGVVGTFHGYVPGAAVANAWLGSRFEMTTTATGAVTGKIITGVAAKPFAGKLNANALTPTVATFAYPALNLVLTLDATTQTLTSTAPALPVTAWRQVWKAVTNPATAYKGLHTFFLTSPTAEPEVPKGHGFGSFTVDEKTGALKVSGKLGDGNALLTTTFLGPQGQVLIYQPLYANKGSFGGVLTLAADHEVTGAPSWYKPAVFGPAEIAAEGTAYTAPTAGNVVMGLPDTANNTRINFTLGGLETEGKEFGITFSLLNPGNPGVGLTNKATFPLFATGENPNKVAMATVTPATGLFSGEFTIPGATRAKDRKVTYTGQITGAQGYGFFLLPDPVNATIKRSGRVVLKAP